MGKEEHVRERIGRPSPALVISVIALIVAVAGGGSAIADGVAKAAKLITGNQIRNGSVTSADIKDRSLLASDFKASERKKLVGPDGPVGPTGVAGSAGAFRAPPARQGPKGDPGRPERRAPTGSSATAARSAAPRTSRRSRTRRRPVYCVRLDPSIDASTAVAVVTANLRTVTTGAVFAIDPQNEECAGVPNSIAVFTTQLVLPDPLDVGTELDEAEHEQGFFILVG